MHPRSPQWSLLLTVAGLSLVAILEVLRPGFVSAPVAVGWVVAIGALGFLLPRRT